MEEIIIIMAVIVSAAYFIRRIYRSFKPKDTKCGCGCEGCNKVCKQK